MTEQKLNIKKAALISAILAGIFFMLAYGTLLWPIGAWINGSVGDGIKNYFTPSWYVEYDYGAQFTGMHYPYGDNIIYSDAQPLLSWFLSLLNTIIPIDGYVPWFMHFFIMCSFMAGAVFLTLILTRWIPNTKIAIPAALFIIFLSPQTSRIHAHYALSYVHIIPMIWYFLLRADEKNYSLKAGLWLFLALLSITFLHLYYFLIGVLLIGLFWVIQVVRKKITVRSILILPSVILFSFLTLWTFLELTGKADLRPEAPYGFFVYKASFASVFIPPYGWLYDLWFSNPNRQPVNNEGVSWMGYGIYPLILLVIYAFLYHVFYKKQVNYVLKETTPYLLTSLFILALSMAIPFIWGMETVLEKIPFLRQFRSPGRFAWTFFYIFLVVGLAIGWQLISQFKSKVGFVLFSLSLLLTGYSAFDQAKYNSQFIKQVKSPNPFLSKDSSAINLLENSGYQPSDFQAMLSLPFFHNGSEKLYIDRTNGQFGNAMVYAYQLGLPMINSMMSRTSITESLELCGLLGHSLIHKSLPASFDERPFLLLVKDGWLLPQEEYFKTKAKLIGHSDGFIFYSLPLSAFDDTQSFLIEDFKKGKDSKYLLQHDEYYSEEPLYFLFRRDFEDMDGNAFRGSGALYSEKSTVDLGEVDVQIENEVWTEVSFWAWAFFETTAFPIVTIELIDKDGWVYQQLDCNPKESTDIDGQWVRGSISFPIYPKCCKIRLTLQPHSRALIDELVVRDTRYNIFYDVSSDNETLIFNNFPIGK